MTIKTKTKDLIPGTYDKMFKAILTDENNKEYLAFIISEITNLPYEKICKEAIIINNEIPVQNYNDKSYRTDVLVKIGKDQVDIEMNRGKYAGIIEKGTMHINTIFSQTLKSGQTYKEMPTIYQININKFKAGESNKIISKAMFMDVDELEILSEKIIIFNINIEKIKEKYYNNHELTRLERALMLLDISDNDLAEKLVGDDNIMENVLSKMQELSNNHDFRIVFDREKDLEIIYNSLPLYL